MKTHPAPPRRRLSLDLLRLRELREQRLRLGDLRHLRRRRKAFERRREDGLGVGGAAGRLAKLGEGKGREQLVAARTLMLGDGDGRPVGVFGWRRVGGIAPEQDVAANAMQQRVGVALPGLFSDR